MLDRMNIGRELIRTEDGTDGPQFVKGYQLLATTMGCKDLGSLHIITEKKHSDWIDSDTYWTAGSSRGNPVRW